LGLHGAQSTFRVAAPLAAVPDEPAVPEAAERSALLASFELQETKQRLEGLARRAGVTLAAGWLPDVSVDVHALQRDSEAAADSSSEKEWRFGAGVSVGIPLFDRGQGERSALQAEFDALLERYYGKAIDLRSAVREARNRVVSAHARARQYHDVIVPAQQRVVAESVLQYNAMQIGVFQLLQARRDELDIRVAYVETLREYWSAAAQLDGWLAGGHAAEAGTSAVPTGGAGSTQATSMGGH
jgi:outer membrane protein TolC